MTFLGKRLAAIEEFTPKIGFNVIGVDDFEPPGEELYVVAHVDTLEKAEAIVRKRHETNPHEILHIYGPSEA